MVLLTLVTVASLQTVGVVLVVAMLITPASTAYLLTNKLWIMIVLAATIGAFSSVAGLYFSFIYNLSSGAVIVLVATFIFALRSEEHTSELQSRGHLVCRLLLEKKKKKQHIKYHS